ncbi:hypothetical protein C8F01DRAFT_1154786 [Mycena amicta]|nr:hypothetical protein C8F01DRAFT_1154786 [Mycena amicta]
MSDIRLADIEAESESGSDETEPDSESVSQSDPHPGPSSDNPSAPVTNEEEDAHAYGKLTRRERAIVRAMREKGWTLTAIASLFTSSPKTITLSRICNNKMVPPDRIDRDELLVEKKMIDEQGNRITRSRRRNARIARAESPAPRPTNLKPPRPTHPRFPAINSPSKAQATKSKPVSRTVETDDVKQLTTPFLPHFASVHPVDASSSSKADFASFLRGLEPTIDLSTRVDLFASNDIHDFADLQQYYSREYDDLVDTFDHMFRRRFLYEVQVGERMQKRVGSGGMTKGEIHALVKGIRELERREK